MKRVERKAPKMVVDFQLSMFRWIGQKKRALFRGGNPLRFCEQSYGTRLPSSLATGLAMLAST